ncbi:MAG: MFS transporter [Gemmatimonadota bacterium]|jgi:DHA3 family macrolide efflux protein-like MFS transporter
MTAKRLFNRDFVLLWQGQLVSQIGNQAHMIALMFWILQTTRSASLMGLLGMSAALPGVLLAPLGGAIADRHSRKGILVAADLVRGVAVLLLATLLFTHGSETRLIVAALFVTAVVIGIMGAVFRPAVGAAIPDLVPATRVQAANSLTQLSSQSSQFVGQAVGGVLFRVLGAPMLFLVDGISYVLSAGSETFIRIPQRLPAARPGLRAVARGYLADTGEGLRWIWQRTGMRTFIFTTTAINFLFMPIAVLLPFYVTDVLGKGAAWYGFLLAALSLGSIVGLLLTGSIRLAGHGRARALGAALFLTALSMGGLGLVQASAVALVLMFVAGLLAAVINVTVLTLLQLATPQELRGRVMGLVMALAGAATPLGMAIGGVLGDLTGKAIPAIYMGVGTAAAATAAGAFLVPAFREFLASEGSS